MSELTFNLIRLGYLALLWVFVFSTVAVLRRDLATRGRSVRASRSGKQPGQRGAGQRGAKQSGNPGLASVPPAAPGVAPAAAMAPVPAPANGAVAPPLVVVGGRQGSGRRAPAQPTHLAVTTGALAGSRLPLTNQPILIGRAASNTLVLEDDYASSRHAQIYPTAGGWVVEDLGSTNGTFLGEQPLVGAAALPVGVPVRIGHSTLELVG